MTRLFLYGTLLDAAFRARIARRPIAGRPALLPGWRRVRLRFAPLPTLRPARGTVAGVVAQVPQAVMRRLRAYEGARYRLAPVRVRCDGRTLRALAWIGDMPTRRDWP